jgi:hypothetical protein
MDPESPTHSAAVAEDSESRVIPLRPEYANGDEPPSVSLRIRKLRVFALLAGLGLLAIVSTVLPTCRSWRSRRRPTPSSSTAAASRSAA